MICGFNQYDAAYVLGALSPAERQRFEEHLAGCKNCARAVRELAGMPGLLSRLDTDTVEHPAPAKPVPATLLPALVEEVRRAQRRRLGLVAGGAVAAAAAVVVGVLTVGGVAGSPPDRSAGAAPTASTSAASSGSTSAPAGAASGRPMTPVGQHRLTAQVGFEEVPWGTRLSLTCSYVGDSHYGEAAPAPSYSLVVRTRDGAVQQVATWRAVPGATTTLTAATASPRAQIASVEVRTMSGRPVLELTT